VWKSREAAKECSPRRKPWEEFESLTSPEGAKEKMLDENQLLKPLFVPSPSRDGAAHTSRQVIAGLKMQHRA